MCPKRLLPVILVAAALLASACGNDDDDGERAGGAGTGGTTTAATPGRVTRADKDAAARTYADLAVAMYGRSIASIDSMADAIDAFLAEPTNASLATARKTWVSARDDYVVTEGFRFYGGPIDDPETGPEGQINAWPMDESYIDYVKGKRDTGIVNDTGRYPQITAATLLKANERGGETNISTGWHAIEFLLWGQDFSATGPGDRPATDYTTARNAGRRKTYLRLATSQLGKDLRGVRAQWVEGGAFRARFLGATDVALLEIVRGIGALNSSELAGERMAVALDSADQEDEHSCFSDNTNADVVNDIRSITAIYAATFPEGSPAPADPTSLQSLVAKVDPALADTLTRQFDATLAKAEAFPATFETMIAAKAGSPENKALDDVVTALEAQGTDLAAAATKLGVKVNFEL